MGGSRLYIVSPDKPSLVGLDEQMGWPDFEPQWGTRSYDNFLSRISVGQTYSFRLVANPVLNRSSRGGASDVTNQENWTSHYLATGGMAHWQASV